MNYKMGQENKGVVPERFAFEVFGEDFDLLAACHHLPLILSLSPSPLSAVAVSQSILNLTFSFLFQSAPKRPALQSSLSQDPPPPQSFHPFDVPDEFHPS